MSLEEFSDEELQQELQKRQELQKKKPSPEEEPDFSELEQMCKDLLDKIDKTGEYSEDDIHFIFEAAMESVFPIGVFDYINARTG